MPELRFDVTADEWVVVAAKRAERPEEFRTGGRPRPAPESKQCPFCPGREGQTPPPTLVLPGEDAWKVRVVPNKFAAFCPESQAEPPGAGFFRRRAALGFHEVVIESPDHEADLSRMSREDVQLVLQAYVARYRRLEAEPHVRLVLIFRNHGAGAGTSLVHPHSQIAAISVLPPAVQRRFDVTRRFAESAEAGVFQKLLEEERKAGERIVSESDHFTVLNPFASRGPFETWILPHRACPSFGLIRDEEQADLAGVLRNTLRRLDSALGNPDYNYAFLSAGTQGDAGFYRWHVEIMPRLATPAGFELGTGMSINTVRPEEAARILREAEP